MNNYINDFEEITNNLKNYIIKNRELFEEKLNIYKELRETILKEKYEEEKKENIIKSIDKIIKILES